MINFDNYLKYSVCVFLIISIIIWIKKPLIIFDVNKNIKPFGVGPNKTIFYYPLILIIMAIIIYFIFFNIYLRKTLH